MQSSQTFPIINQSLGPQTEKFSGCSKVNTGPPNLIGPPKALSRGPYCFIIFFLSNGRRPSFKSEGDNDIHIQLGPMKNTTRHKTGLGEHCELPQWGLGGAPEALALFMFLQGKIQHLINIPAPNWIKLTSRKRDIHERKYVKWGMMTLIQYYTIS